VAKVVIASLSSKRERAPVAEKRVRDPSGRVRTVRTIDVGSATFGEDLRYVFGKNVAKARRDNKRVADVTDATTTKR
jgi:hypothetical protein